ncbi:uncharacterized protein LOC130590061 [Beta vulgaris subsp. vulgaris]|uniref:uncharacterized protein LOC130590061 n=1 Tax=Beta vulgaris subsp. vulgaris TaxID=3555 RepID=UPI00254801EE|nr:uncharacterized protein LOC130590061 [Beta vulgaris subsp. vulgaris]
MHMLQAPLAIQYPEFGENVTFELKSGLVHLLPSFHGLNGEDPIKHLTESHAVCTSMQPRGVKEDQIKLRAFPFSLTDKANDWFYHLSPNSINTWRGMKQAFFEKFFPSSKLNEFKRAISNIEQGYDELLYDYLERFKRLVACCPYHGFAEKDFVLYLVVGLLPDERRMVNAACGGNIDNKTPQQAMELISEFAESYRTYSKRNATRGVKAASSESSLESEVSDLKNMFRQFMTSNKPQQGKACGIGSNTGHPTDACPTLQEDTQEVNALGYQGNRKYDPYSNSYNPGWKDHPAFSYKQGNKNFQGNRNFQGNQNFQQGNRPPPFKQPYQPQGQSSSSKSMSTEDMIKALTKNVTTMQSNMVQFQQETKSSIYNLETQVGQMSSVMNRLVAQTSGKLPSQTEVNPKKNLSVVTLRSGKELIDHAPEKGKVVEEQTRVEDEEVEVLTPSKEVEEVVSPSSHQEVKSFPDYKPTPPFPDALKDNRKLDLSKDIYETFSQCNVNIRLLQLIKTVPLYAKWLKEMCSIKRKSSVKGKQTVKVSEHGSVVFQKRMPKKCDDPGMFTIPITLGDTKINRAMLDLGASINVLPYSLYESLTLGDLLPTNVVIQLADISTSIPRGVVEDVLVVVDKLTFPADFYVIDMEHDKHSAPILLGRLFLKTAKTKIDCDTYSLAMQFDGQIIEFNMYDAMRYFNIEDHSLCAIDVFEPCVQGVFDVLRDDDLQSVLDFSLNADSLEFCLPDNVLEIVVELNELSKLPLNPSNYKPMPLTVPSTRPLPSVVQAPDVELKTLPGHLKFVFLSEKEILPVIISTS